MQDERPDILERLAHPELEAERARNFNKETRLLKVRNILNLIFILLAFITMVSIGWYLTQDAIPSWCYLLGIIAVIVKMCEAALRMPSLISSNTSRHRKSR